MSGEHYDPTAVEAKWRARWAERHTNEPDLDRAERPFYNLMMFPYPSAEGLHVGNVFAFTGADIHGRFRRLQGYDVFEPIGFDAFGIHSENYALKVGIHPAELIPKNIANFRRQLSRSALMFDWEHEVDTTRPAYYRWTQWIFLKLLRGVAWRVQQEGPVNWCPTCKTVLANEQVIAGDCERCGTKVEQRFLEQWFFRITDYAERLLDNLDMDRLVRDHEVGAAELDRPLRRRADRLRDGRRRAPHPRLHHPARHALRRDVHGARAGASAGRHPHRRRREGAGVRPTARAAAKQDLVSRKIGDKEKTGVFTGAYAVNPATGETIPVWIADYVLMEYGTGAIMAVPAHDERDFEFATSVQAADRARDRGAGRGRRDAARAPAPDDGRRALVNSGPFDGHAGRNRRDAAIVAWLEREGKGKGVAQYRLHDWCISRQRYWGPPIPIIYCDDCGIVPVPGEGPAGAAPRHRRLPSRRPAASRRSRATQDWYQRPCPSAAGRRVARPTSRTRSSTRRGTSCATPRPSSTTAPSTRRGCKKWLPVRPYIGGNEHAVLHLLVRALRHHGLHDLGYSISTSRSRSSAPTG